MHEPRNIPAGIAGQLNDLLLQMAGQRPHETVRIPPPEGWSPEKWALMPRRERRAAIRAASRRR